MRKSENVDMLNTIISQSADVHKTGNTTQHLIEKKS